MEDVTDFPFRQVLLKIGRPDVFFTEFVNVDGFTSRGKKHVAHRLEKTSEENPIIVQFWGNDPKKFVKAARLVREFNFQGININLGCPVKKVMKVGCGSALIGNYSVTKEIVNSLQELDLKCPVSVKTRVGLETFDEKWVKFLLNLGLESLFLHGRTVRQLFKGKADWELIGEVVKIKNVLSPNTKIIGNGDIKTIEEAERCSLKYGVDGVMIGREVMKNPWVFSQKTPTEKERIETLLLHMVEMEKFTQNFSDKGWSSIKKFYNGYLRENKKLTSLRNELFQTNSLQESINILRT